jgi:hypothetical protein
MWRALRPATPSPPQPSGGKRYPPHAADTELTISQASETRNTGFRRWFEAGFGSETLPIIPPGATLVAGSEVRAEHLGKTPGTRKADGSWAGLSGKWSDTLIATVADAKQWVQWGASVGLQSRLYLGLDIDVESEEQAAAVEALALDYLGLAPVRFRDGSPRRLLVYKRAGEVISKRRLAYADAAGVKHAVELLGKGQQYLVEGPHSKGGVYQWRHGESPCEWTPAGSYRSRRRDAGSFL